MVASSISSLSHAFDMSQTDLEQSGHANLNMTFDYLNHQSIVTGRIKSTEGTGRINLLAVLLHFFQALYMDGLTAR
jgi:hypothetical protein